MRRISVLAAIIAIVGTAVFAAPSVGHAVTITSVVVNVGASTFQGCIGACANKVWDLGPAGINLSPGQTLVLTQNGGGVSQFDTSDLGNLTASLTINGNPPLTDTAKVLTNGGIDPAGGTTTTHNEATQYGPSIGGVANSYQVQLGYADNLHTDVCGSGSAQVGAPTCFPSNGDFAGATFFLGVGGQPPAGYPQSANPNHCNVTTPTCFDSGVILITALRPPTVPEPSSLLLLGAGLVGMAVYSGRRLKRSS